MARIYHRNSGPAEGQKVFIATPSYQAVEAGYAYALFNSLEALSKAGIASELAIFSGDCHVDDARNRLVRDFLETDCTDLVFIDSDMYWQPEDLVKLCRYDLPVVGASYPFKQEDEGFPAFLMEGRLPNPMGLLEVVGLPTGFLKIQRHVLERLAKFAPKFKPKSDSRGLLPLIFERTLEGNTRWGGDYSFCRKWRDIGGKIYADIEITLEHHGAKAWKGSLGAHMRKQSGNTLKYVVDKIGKGEETLETLREAREFVGNKYGALEDILYLCVTLARKADGPIIETGSGLTTILMAAANSSQQVWCFEHDPYYAGQLRQMAAQAGVKNIMLCKQAVKKGWYDLSDLPELPKHFAVGLNDGPPRNIGSRTGFFPALAHCVETIICDDADDPNYKKWLTQWSFDNGRKIDFIEPRAALIRKEA